MNYHIEKRAKVVSALPDGIVALVLNDKIDGKKCNRDFFYLTGIEAPSCIYMLSKLDGEAHETFFVPHGNPLRVHFESPQPTEEEIFASAGITDVRYLEELEPALYGALSKASVIGVDIDPRQGEYPMIPSRAMCEKLRREWPGFSLRNIYWDIAKERAIKTDEEISFVMRAMDATDIAIRRCMKECKAGMYEYQLDAIFRYKLGMLGLAPGYPSTIAAGGNEFALHYSASTGVISDGDLVLMDVGAECNGYCVDISRVFPANGRFSDKQRKIYEAALRGNLAIQEAVKLGASSDKLNADCRASVYESLKALGIIEKEEETSKYYWHRTSHHIGLDVHDNDRYDFTVAPGMLFSVDAGIYVTHPEWNIGLRVEDDCLVDKNGECNLISRHIPREIDEIEAICRGEA